MDDQDWTPVILNKQKKVKQPIHNAEAKRLYKLENDDVLMKPKMLSQESRQMLIKFRVDNKLSQSDLDARCCFAKNSIQQIESNKRPPSNSEIQILNSLLKARLILF